MADVRDDFQTIRELAEAVGIEAQSIDVFLSGTTDLLAALGRIEAMLSASVSEAVNQQERADYAERERDWWRARYLLDVKPEAGEVARLDFDAIEASNQESRDS